MDFKQECEQYAKNSESYDNEYEEIEKIKNEAEELSKDYEESYVENYSEDYPENYIENSEITSGLNEIIFEAEAIEKEIIKQKQKNKQNDLKKLREKFLAEIRSKASDRIGQGKAAKELLSESESSELFIAEITNKLQEQLQDKENNYDIIELSKNDKLLAGFSQEDRELIRIIVDSIDLDLTKEIHQNNNSNISKVTAENINRLTTINKDSIKARFTEIMNFSGLSSGEDSNGYFGNRHFEGRHFEAIWIKGVVAANKQAKENDHQAYKGKSKGVVVGMDYRVNDDMVFGISYNYFDSSLKFQNKTIPQIIKIKSNGVSLYNNLDITNNLYGSSIVGFTKNKIKTYRIITAGGKRYHGKGKFLNRGYDFSGELGYRIKFKNNSLMIIPNIGADYSYNKDSQYQERDLGIDNRQIDANSYKILTGKLAIKVQASKSYSSGLKLQPHIGLALIHKAKNSRKVQSKIGFDGNSKEIKIKGREKAELKVNLGLTVNVSNKIDISTNYIGSFKKEYRAHQGYIQMKIYF